MAQAKSAGLVPSTASTTPVPGGGCLLPQQTPRCVELPDALQGSDWAQGDVLAKGHLLSHPDLLEIAFLAREHSLFPCRQALGSCHNRLEPPDTF